MANREALRALQTRLAERLQLARTQSVAPSWLAAPALVLRAMEAAVQRFMQQPEQCTQDAAAKIESASFALTEYLEGVLADKPISPVSLFPQYRQVQELVRADRIHPADLWPCDWRWLEPELGTPVEPQNYADGARAVLDQCVLQIMRGKAPQAAATLKDLSLRLSVGQADRQPRIFWKIAAAYFEALIHDLLPADIYVKRAASRVLLQYASLSKGDITISERLAQDLLFFCSQAVSSRAADTPVLSAVRATYGLARFKPVDYEAVQFGCFDPALLAQARQRILPAAEVPDTVSFELPADAAPVTVAPLAEPTAEEINGIDFESLAVLSGQFDDALAQTTPLVEVADVEMAGASDAALDDQIKVIGALRIGIPLYNVYLNEADEWSRRLITEVAEWAIELHQPVGDSAVALAHSLAGSSATVGFAALSKIARALEHALRHSQTHYSQSAALKYSKVFVDASEDIRRLLHQFAAGFLKQPDAGVLERIHGLDFSTPVAVSPEDAKVAAVVAASPALAKPTVQSFDASSTEVFAGSDDGDDEFDAVDAIDPELFPIFEEEATELMPQLGAALRQWSARPDNASARMEVLRALHTLKGSARLAGAMRVGEMAHRIESEIEYLGSEVAATQDFEPLLSRFDAMEHAMDALRRG